MKFRLTALAFALCLNAAHAQAPAALLSQLDAASKTFHSAQANVSYDDYVRVVRDHTIQTGSIFIERTGSGENMGAIFYDLGPDGKPTSKPAKILAYNGGTLQIDSPGIKQVDVFKAGANQAKYESFLTLGFGGSGSDLAKAWDIKDLGPETIDGVKTEKLDLTSKDPGVRNMFTHVTIWIDAVRGLSLKQQFFAPNGDTRTATYSNIKLNASINKKPYDISKSDQRIQH